MYQFGLRVLLPGPLLAYVLERLTNGCVPIATVQVEAEGAAV